MPRIVIVRAVPAAEWRPMVVPQALCLAALVYGAFTSWPLFILSLLGGLVCSAIRVREALDWQERVDRGLPAALTPAWVWPYLRKRDDG